VIVALEKARGFVLLLDAVPKRATNVRSCSIRCSDGMRRVAGPVCAAVFKAFLLLLDSLFTRSGWGGRST
jgi:hypothetical protein